MSPANDNILDKVRKLLRLADPARGATEHEQEAAASAAQRLLLEHNLHMGDVSGLDADERVDEGIERDDLDITGKQSHINWKISLLWKISTPLMTKGCWSPRSKTMHIIGTKTNTEIVKYLFTYLALTIEKMANAHVKGQRDLHKAIMEEWTATDTRRAFTSFCIGAGDTLKKRLEAQYQHAATTTSNTTALALRNERAVQEAFKKEFPYTNKHRISSGGDDASLAAGQEAAKQIALHQGVGSAGVSQHRQIG